MLVLTRRPNEAIRVGDEIGIVVLEIRGNQVRIGVQAPKHINVDREEIYLRKIRAAESKAIESQLPPR